MTSSLMMFVLVIMIFVTLECQTMTDEGWTPTQTERGYVVCTTSTLKPFYGAHVPNKHEIVQRVGCSLARDEYELLMVGVHAISEPVHNVRITV